MIAVDTNVLVYAHRSDAPFHAAATRILRALAEDGAAWGLPWPCLHEFLAIVTHPRIFNPPTPLDRAWSQVEAWLASPSLVLLSEATGYEAILGDLLLRAQVNGPRVHDARIAALCIHHRVSELWTADRDFGRFASLTVRNPLVAT